MKTKKLFTLDEIVEFNRKSFLKELGKISKNAEPLIFDILDQKKDVLKNIRTAPLSDVDFVQILKTFQNYGMLSSMEEVINIAQNQRKDKTIEFLKIHNNLLAMRHLDEIGHYCFPNDVLFEKRWDSPRFPVKPKLKRWLPAYCTDVSRSDYFFTYQEKVKNEVNTYFMKVSKEKIQQKIKKGQFLEIHVYPNKILEFKTE